MFAVVIMLGGFLVVGLAVGLLVAFLYNAVWPEFVGSLTSGAVEEGMVLSGAGPDDPTRQGWLRHWLPTLASAAVVAGGAAVLFAGVGLAIVLLCVETAR